MKTLLSFLDLLKVGMNIYSKWSRNRPYRDYQKQMDKLDEELRRRDDKLTNEILEEVT